MNKIYALSLLVVTALLSGCKAEEEKAIDIAEKEVRSSLLDPKAGQFKNMRALQLGDSSHSYMVCGEVNGKNTLGAYTGYADFNAYIFDIREREPIATVALNSNSASVDERLLFKQQNLACNENGVKLFLEKQAETSKAKEKRDSLKETKLGKAIFDAASDSTYVSRELGDSQLIREVYAREGDKYAYVSVTNFRTPDFYKFRKNDKGEFVPVNGLSYTGYPSSVQQCSFEQTDHEKCITEDEIKTLIKAEYKFEDFIVPPEE